MYKRQILYRNLGAGENLQHSGQSAGTVVDDSGHHVTLLYNCLLYTSSFLETELPDAHPNTARIHLTGERGKATTIVETSTGGGNILVTEIDLSLIHI